MQSQNRPLIKDNEHTPSSETITKKSDIIRICKQTICTAKPARSIG
jgi:hypothetical protein